MVEIICHGHGKIFVAKLCLANRAKPGSCKQPAPKGLFVWEASQPRNRHSLVREISVDGYLPIGRFFSFVLTSAVIALQAESHLNLA